MFLNVAVIEDTFVHRFVAAKGSDQQFPLDVYKALVDTGAQSTCITRKVAEELNLIPIGKVAIRGVSGLNYHNNYLFKVGFPFATPTEQEDVLQGSLHVVEKAVEGAELAIEGGAFDVLLGMDIIGLGSLKIDGDGSFSFSF